MTKVNRIEYVGEEEQQCISVAAKDHLYITKDNIVTENTIVSGTMTELGFFREAGKALALDTPIITPDGYKLMRDIQVGDRVVTPTGRITGVRGIYPQGITKNYKITTADNREIIACENHKWKVCWAAPRKWNKETRRYDGPHTPNWQILTTRKIFESKRRWYLPLSMPVPYPEKSHFISPYLLGAWLGDGSARAGCFIIASGTGDHTECEQNILQDGIDEDYKLNWVPKAQYYRLIRRDRATPSLNRYCQELRRLNLFDKRSNTKFIPDEYLYDSVNNRIALLQGLLDTDGHVGSRGQIVYATTAVALRDGVQHLVHSLGGFASWRKTITYKNHHLQGYVVQISFPSKEIIPFRLSRKQKRLTARWEKKKYNHRQTLSIKSIVVVDPGPTQCITVEDEEHMYLAGSYIPTHNSDDYIYKFFTKLRGRIESRMKGNYFGRFILDSSPNTLESPIDDWIVNEAHKNPVNYIVQGARWKYAKDDFPKDTFDENGNVRPEKAFQVFIGGKGRPPAIIDKEHRNQFSPEEVIDVPDTFLVRGQFEENIYEALKDQAGIPAGSSDKIFYDHSKVERIFDTRLKSIYTHIIASSKEDPQDIIWNQVKDQFFVKYINSYQFWYKPHIPRVFAVDQSISGDVTSIAIAHLEREMRATPGTATAQSSLIYVVDLVVPITPKGGRINLDAIRYFLEDLRDKGSMQLIYGSFDQFQSEATMQYLLRRGFEIEKLSVDKEMDPYLNFISIIESDRLRAGRNIHFKNNLKSLQITRRKGEDGKRTGSQKVDHTNGELVLEGSTVWESSLIGIHAKDVADSVCACCELLRKHDVIPYETWDPENIKEPTRDDARKSVEAFLAKNKWAIS